MSETYTYHLAVYSKLIEGHNPMGAIKRGTEARVNGMTADFPPHLFNHCRPADYFSGEPLITEIDPRIINGGAFIAMPLLSNGTHYSVFARIEARSEAGEGKPGRKYTHCALIFVENHWEPGLIQWAAEMLFTAKHGERCWGIPVAEYDKSREKLPVPPLAKDVRNDLPLGGVLSCDTEGDAPLCLNGSLRTAYAGIEGEAHPYVALGAQVGEILNQYDYSIAGRWLSIGMGIGPGAKSDNAKDFFVRLDMRDEDELSDVTLPLFDDFNPAKKFNPISSAGLSPVVDWSDLHGPNRDGDRYEFLLTDDMLWDFQRTHVKEARLENTLAPLEPAPEPIVAAAAEVRAGFDHGLSLDYGNSDPMRWPELRLAVPPFLQEDNDVYDDTAYALVFDEIRIGRIRPSLQQIVRRCSILDPDAGYDTLNLSPDYDRLASGWQSFVEFLASYMILANPEELMETVEDLLTHGPIEALDLPHASRGGLLQKMVSYIFTEIGEADMIRWMERKYRFEDRRVPDLRRKGLLSGHYNVYRFDGRRVRDFLAWLDGAEGHEPSARCDINAVQNLAEDVAMRIRVRWGLEDGPDEDEML